VAAFEISSGTRRYSSLPWNVLEYLTLFLIVLLHEFGHVLACRQVGGEANQIMLWPLGGVAYVDPPPRPGAYLWTMTAGPLVNIALLPALSAFWILTRSLGWRHSMPNTYIFLRSVWAIDLVLLIFNLLPIYPLDGGQILRSLLWFVVGRARSLMAVTILGVLGVAGLLLIAVWTHSVGLGVLSLFMLLSCWTGINHARRLSRAEGLPLTDETGGASSRQIIAATYSEIVDPKLQERARSRFAREIESLQPIGFRHLAYSLETLGPYSAILHFPLILFMLPKREVFAFPPPFRLAVAEVVLFHTEPSSLALCSGMGVKFYTCFSDKSLVISTTYASRIRLAPSSGITRIFESPNPQDAWLRHKTRISEMEREGKTIIRSASLPDFVEFCNRQNDLSHYAVAHD